MPRPFPRKLMRRLAGPALAVGLWAAPDGVAAQDMGVETDIQTSGKIDAPIELDADRLYFDHDAETVRARGNVIVTYKTGTLRAQALDYDIANDRVRAIGPFTMEDETGNIIMARDAMLEDKLNRGQLEDLKITLENNAWMTARSAVRQSPKRARLQDAAFSLCEVCEEDPVPTWALRAGEVIHDQNSHNVYYRDVRFELFGAPILYLPYFQHPDPTVKRRTGILMPYGGRDSELGFFAELPVFWNLAPNSDITLTPAITTKERAYLKTEYRHRFSNGSLIANGSITYVRERDDNNNETGDNVIRGHIFANGKWNLDANRAIGFDLARASDETYLRRYSISNLDTLMSRLFFERTSGLDHLYVDAYAFQTQLDDVDQDETPLILPLVDYQFVSAPRFWGGRFAGSISSLGLYRIEGTDLARLSTSFSWSKTYLTTMGDIFTLTGLMRTDVIATQDEPGLGGTDESDIAFRFEPLASLEWRRPFARPGETFTQVIEPIVIAVLAPYDGSYKEFPNEDSLSFEFDQTNLLGFDRYPGRDQWEGGPRLIAGLRWGFYGPENMGFRIFVGQNYRLKDNRAFDTRSGLRRRLSDIVGQIDMFLFDVVSLTHRFRFNYEDGEFARNELDFVATPERFTLRIGYIDIAENLIGSGFEGTEEINLDLTLNLFGSWGILGGVRYDMTEDGGPLLYRAGLIYQDDCYYFELGLKRKLTSDRDIPPSTIIGIRVNLRQLG